MKGSTKSDHRRPVVSLGKRTTFIMNVLTKCGLTGFIGNMSLAFPRKTVPWVVVGVLGEMETYAP